MVASEKTLKLKESNIL